MMQGLRAILSALTLGLAAALAAMGPAAAQVPEIRVARQFSMGYLQFNVMEKHPLNGIDNWRDMAQRIRKVPHVIAVSPALYTPAFLMAPLQSHAGVLKGIDVDSELAISETLRHLKSGSVSALRNPGGPVPVVILRQAAVPLALNRRLRWVSITPFGVPVVPDV